MASVNSGTFPMALLCLSQPPWPLDPLPMALLWLSQTCLDLTTSLGSSPMAPLWLSSFRFHLLWLAYGFLHFSLHLCFFLKPQARGCPEVPGALSRLTERGDGGFFYMGREGSSRRSRGAHLESRGRCRDGYPTSDGRATVVPGCRHEWV